MRLIVLLTTLGLVLAPLEARAWSPWMIQAPASGGESSEAQVDLDAAKVEYRLASDAYALGNYEQAIEHFERAYELSQEPALLFDLGQAYTRWYDLSNELEQLKKARRMYENYVINLDASDLGDEERAIARSDAQRRITEVDRRVADHRESNDAIPGPSDDPAEATPIHKKPWFWVAIVGGLAVVAAGVTTGVLLGARSDEFQPELGTIGRAPGSGGFTLRF